MTFPTNLDMTWVNSGAVALDAGELRRADAAMFAGIGSALGAGGGVVRHGDTSLMVTVDGADVVTVQPGPVVIPGNAVIGTGVYRCALGTAATGSLTARHATNTRIDLVVFRAMDTDVVGTHGAYTGRIEIIAGTPSGSPVVPTLPTMAVELGRITVPQTGGGAASVDSSYRTYAAAVGAESAFPTAARLPVAGATYQRAVALDTGVRYRWSGSAWVVDAGNSFPYIVRFMSIDQSIANATLVQLTMNSTERSVGSWLPTGGNCTVPETGLYLISGTASWASSATGRRHMEARIGGTTVVLRSEIPGAVGAPAHSVAGDVWLTAGQVLGLYVYQTSGGALSIIGASAPTRFTARRVA